MGPFPHLAAERRDPGLKRLLLMLFGILAVLGACRRDEGPAWDADLLVPLVADDLGLADLIPDSLLEVDEDSTLRIVYRNDLYRFNLVEEGIAVPDTSLLVFISLDSLSLEDRTIQVPITLGRILQEVPGGPLLISLIVAGFPVEIPPLDSIGSGVFPVDATEFFHTATVDSGWLDIRVDNGLVVDLTDAVFRLSDPAGGFDILLDTFPMIPSGGFVESSADLSGLTVHGLLEAELIEVSTPGSGSAVSMDTADAVLVTASVRDIRVIEATAAFPAQDLVSIQTDIDYHLGGPRVTWMEILEGEVVVSIVNTIAQEIFVDYTIPGADGPGGETVEIHAMVPAAPPGGSMSVEETFDLAGYEIDLTGNSGNAFNAFYNEFTARIESTGEIVSIGLDDSIQVIYGLRDLVPSALRGYAGSHLIELDQEQSFEFLGGVREGVLDLESLRADLTLINGLGVVGGVRLDALRSVNSRTGATVALDAPSLIGVTLPIHRAIDNPFVPGLTAVGLDEDNSNVDALIENFPDRIEMEGEVAINPEGNQFNYQDFVYHDEGIRLALDLEMPLSFTAESLVLEDTVAFDLLGSGDASLVIRAGTLRFTADNGFPLQANLQVEFLDDAGEILTTLFDEPETIEAGVLGPDCRVETSAPLAFETAFAEGKADLLRRAVRAVLRVDFSTTSSAACQGYIKLYSDYRLGFHLVGELEIDVVTDF